MSTERIGSGRRGPAVTWERENIIFQMLVMDEVKDGDERAVERSLRGSRRELPLNSPAVVASLMQFDGRRTR